MSQINKSCDTWQIRIDGHAWLTKGGDQPWQTKIGCGHATHVSGTNGGMMPCGGMLTALGKTGQYFCAKCSEKGLRSVHE